MRAEPHCELKRDLIPKRQHYKTCIQINSPIFLIWMMCWVMGKAAWFSGKSISINSLIHCLLYHAITWNTIKLKWKVILLLMGSNGMSVRVLYDLNQGDRKRKCWILFTFLLNDRFTNLQYVHPLSFQVLFTKRNPLQHMYISLIIILKTNTFRMNFFVCTFLDSTSI